MSQAVRIHTTRQLRERMEAAVERRIAAMDLLDAYTEELEPEEAGEEEAAGEPSLGATANVNQVRAWRAPRVIEADLEFDGDTAASADSEPSLGSIRRQDQTTWSHGRSNDAEDEHDGAEPSLGALTWVTDRDIIERHADCRAKSFSTIEGSQVGWARGGTQDLKTTRSHCHLLMRGRQIDSKLLLTPAPPPMRKTGVDLGRRPLRFWVMSGGAFLLHSSHGSRSSHPAIRRLCLCRAAGRHCHDQSDERVGRVRDLLCCLGRLAIADEAARLVLLALQPSEPSPQQVGMKLQQKDGAESHRSRCGMVGLRGAGTVVGISASRNQCMDKERRQLAIVVLFNKCPLRPN
jgi:hypothetical protein